MGTVGGEKDHGLERGVLPCAPSLVGPLLCLFQYILEWGGGTCHDNIWAQTSFCTSSGLPACQHARRSGR